MSKQANKTMIGGFVVGAVALLFIGIVIFGSGRFMEKTLKFVLYFEGSVNGLDVGAPVVFRGVKVGSVTKVSILADARDMSVRIPVIIEVDPDRMQLKRGKRYDPLGNAPRLIKRGLRAQLTLQSMITGQLMIQFDFYPDEPARLVGADSKYTELPTIPSTIEQLTQKLENLHIEETFNNFSTAIAGLEKIINSKEILKTISSLYLTMEDLRGLVQRVDKDVMALVSTADTTFKHGRSLIQNLDSRIGPLFSDTQGTLKSYDKLASSVNRQVEPLAIGVDEAVKAFAGASLQAQNTLRAMEGVVSEDSALAFELTSTLKELSSAARSIRVWADYLERHPEALIRGK